MSGFDSTKIKGNIEISLKKETLELVIHVKKQIDVVRSFGGGVGCRN